jgi:tRNA (guanine-N7-)-methyltransferase
LLTRAFLLSKLLASQTEKLKAHSLFELVSEEELESDPAAKVLMSATEEGQKVQLLCELTVLSVSVHDCCLLCEQVARNNGQTFRSVFRRVAGVVKEAAALGL